LSQGKIISTISSFSSDNQNNHTFNHGSDTHFTYAINHVWKLVLIINIYEILDCKTIIYRQPLSMGYLIPTLVISLSKKQNIYDENNIQNMINRVGKMCVAAMIQCMIVLIVTRKRGDGRYYFAL
jgi:glucose uptake protein GlcU